MKETEKDNEKFLKLEKEVERLKRSLKKQRYGLVWMDVPEAFEDDVANRLPILEEVPKLAIKSKDGKPTHILIEGDNYHALTCLNYTHKGKIDVIYIDPPYNTGSDGFRYKDKRIVDKFPDGTEVPKDHPFRHSYWLSFMGKRLELAKDLLSNDGVIFISIDDNEFAQLKLLCDEIFGPSNYVGTITWERKRKGSHLSRKFTKKTEYIHIYSKKGDEVELFGSEVSKEGDGPLIKRTNAIKALAIPKEVIQTKLKDGTYRIGKYGKGSSAVELLKNVVVKDGKFQTDLHIKGPFVWSQSMVDEQVSLGAQFFIKTNNFSLRALKGNLDGNYKALSSLFLRDVGTNEDAKTELASILGIPEDQIPIEYPKPVSLVKKLLESKTFGKKRVTILDFFAGSGTTGQAVVELNEENKEGLHQFILVTNNEGDIMVKACLPRLESILKKKVLGVDFGDGLKYYKTAFVGKNNILDVIDQDKIELAYNAGGLLAIAENTLDLIEKNDYWQFFENKDRYTAIYFKEEADKFDDFLKKVGELERPTTVYVFSWDSEGLTDDFAMMSHVRVKAIPQPILEIYKRIYNLEGNDH